MDELRQLDEVAYVRFASVYRHFEDVEAFHEEIQRLRSQRALSTSRDGKRPPSASPGGRPTAISCRCFRRSAAGKSEESGAPRTPVPDS